METTLVPIACLLLLVGFVAVIVHPASNQPMQLWRFGDARGDPINLNQARRLHTKPK